MFARMRHCAGIANWANIRATEMRERTRRLRLLGVLFLFLLPGLRMDGAAAVQDASPAQLTEIRVTLLDSEVDIDLIVSGPFQYSLLELSSPPRFVVDLEPVLKVWPASRVPVQAFGVEAVRVSQFEPRKSRVVFDLNDPKAVYRVSRTGEGVRVIFLKREGTPAGTAPAAQPTAKPAAKPATEAGAAEALGPRPARPGVPTTLVGVSVITYRLTDARFAEVYGKQTGWSWGLEFDQFFLPGSRLRPGLGIDYSRLTKSGVSTQTQTPASILLDPVTITGYLLYEARPVSPFVGAGAAFSHYRESSALHNTDGSATGYAFQAGVFVHLGRLDFLKIKLTGRYAKTSVTVNDLALDLGGTSFALTALAGFNI